MIELKATGKTVFQPGVQHLSTIALACAKVCKGVTLGQEVLAPFCVTYEAGLPLHYLRRIVEGKGADPFPHSRG